MSAFFSKWLWVDGMGAFVLSLLPPLALTLPWLETSVELHERLVMAAFGIGIYLLTSALAVLLFTPVVQQRHRSTFGFSLCKVLGWFCRWHGMVAWALIAGGLGGSLLYVLGGLLLGMSGNIGDFALAGARDGAFFLLVWAPGAAIIVCIIQAFGFSDGSRRRSVSKQR